MTKQPYPEEFKIEAVKQVLPQLRGAFALAIAFKDQPDMLIGARLGSPLVVGYGEGETYLGSDALALAPLRTGLGQVEAEGPTRTVMRADDHHPRADCLHPRHQPVDRRPGD